MSTERVSFGLNSLIPEAYRTKAEAFAKCLHHKLLSLGKVDASTSCRSDSTRLNKEERQSNSTATAGNCIEILERKSVSSSTDRLLDKTEGSDEELCSHSESENGDWSGEKKCNDRRKQKLTSMSSEDSTVESWSSCQENLTDLEKFDSENEEINHFASQIKGSPKLKSFNIRTKRKEFREKSWKRNSGKTPHSSPAEVIDSENIKQSPKLENFDSESNFQYILLEAEDVEVPHRILRDESSSSTSNLERHFSPGENVNGLRPRSEAERQDLANTLEDEEEYINSRLQFAKLDSNSEETQFVEVESLKDFNANGVTKAVRKIGDVIVECPNYNSEAETFPNRCCERLIITSAEIFVDGEVKEEEESEKRNANSEQASFDEEDKTMDLAEDDEMLSSRSKMRRCSSLKTYKTPPGTPGSKKIVRFADALGLDLADVRTFLDEIPKIPSSAFENLDFEVGQSEKIYSPPAPAPTLVPLFQYPGTRMDFLEKVKNQKICLESAIVTDVGVLTLTGYVRVLNINFHKTVHVRYSLNGWRSFSDLQATYVPNSSDGLFDKFSFVLFGHTLNVGDKLEFALRLECSGVQFWDNNGGINYIFHCLPQTCATNFFSSLSTTQIDPWCDFY